MATPDQAALNLRMSKERIALAKRLAGERGTSVSAMVSEFFEGLERLQQTRVALHPLLQGLAGSIPGMEQSRKIALEDLLEEKYGSAS